MSPRLQKFDHRSSPYERVDQKWLCGHSAEGKPCRIGPDRRGRCRAGGECVPRRSGDAWLCTRPSNAGGPCDRGPLPDGSCCRQVPPCVPVTGIRARRARSVRWVLAVTVGMLALFLNGSDARLSPGSLTFHHQNIGSCDGCHSDSGGGGAGILRAALAPRTADSMSGACLDCHQLGEQALSPHGLAPGALDSASGKSNAGSVRLATLMFGNPVDKNSEFACATCHTEHRGTEFDMRRMSNQRCQSCHGVKFASFSDGHPGFSDYPYRWRTRIAFDHVSHIKRHFPESGADTAPELCSDCHRPDPTGRMMLLGSFSNVCAGCHLDQVEGRALAGPPGIRFIAVPGLDVDTLRRKNAAIGHWPEFAEAAPTPFLRLLLEARGDLGDAFERIDGRDLLDLEDASQADIDAVARIAWGFKELMHDLVNDGFGESRETLSRRFGRTLDRTALRRMVGGLSLDTLRAANAAWFPDLRQEVSRHRAGLEVPMAGGEAPAATAHADQESADAPAGGDGDDILAGLDAQSDAPEISGGGDDILSSTGDTGPGDDILGGLEGGGGDDILSSAGEAGPGDDILGGLGDGAGGDDILSSTGEAGPGDDILGGLEGSLLSEPEQASTRPLEAAAGDEPSTEVDAEAWTELGGWYLQYFSIYYRPLGHADRFLRTWLDVSADTYGSVREPAGRAVFEHLTDEDAPGQCAKCHTVDQEADGRLNVKWKPARPRPGTKPFTRFAHVTHFSLLDDAGCRTCHSVAMDRPGDDAHQQSFEKMSVENCAGCHVPRQAGDTCLLCHNYHVGEFPTAPVPTRMSAAKDGGG